MTVNVALASETPQTPLQSRAPLSVLSTAAGTDAAAAARQQLPSAVPAPALIAAYNAGVQPQQARPVIRTVTAQPSSALAAQFIAQDAATSESDLQIFTPRAAPSNAPPPEDDYLRDMRIARGDIGAEPKATTNVARANAAVQENANANIQNKPVAQAADQTMRASLSTIVSGLPALLAPLRRPTLFNARGVSAYQLTTERNAALKKELAEAS